MTPAQALQAKHDAAERAKHIPAEFHKASVEEVVDDEDRAEARIDAVTNTNGDSATEAGPAELSETAKGKRKATEPTAKTTVDIKSEELFPSLGGGPKASAPAGPGAWGNKKATSNLRTAPNGVSNGRPLVSSPPSSGRTTPRSGVLTPASPNVSSGQRGNVPTKMSLPGRFTNELTLLLSEMNKNKPMKPVLDNLQRVLRVQIQTNQTMYQDHPSLKFTVSGQREQVQKALTTISKELTSQQKVTMEVPSSIRAHIIGKGGSKIKEIMERTGAKIQVAKDSGASAGVEEDDSSLSRVEIEGDAIATRNARTEIESIVAANAVKANLRLKTIPAEFFPFIAGPHNSRVNELQQGKDVQITVPPFHTWHQQPQPQISQLTPHPDMHIHITGDLSEAQKARVAIESLAEELRQQLRLKEHNFQRGQHQFIVGDRGMSPQDFLEQTGCVILPPSEMDIEDITIIGPPDRLEGAFEKASALAGELNSVSLDPRKTIAHAPNGADAHARALAQYFAMRGLEEEFQRRHGTQIAFPADMSGNWDLFTRDNSSLPKARADLVDVIRAHPPSRLTFIEVDPFFHPHLREQSVHTLRNDFGVHMIVPEDEEAGVVTLVYDGPAEGDTPFQLPRQRPSDAEMVAFEEVLDQARNQILSIIGDQQDILTKKVNVPPK